MIEFPDSATFAAAFADRRFLAAAVIAATAGLVRGFSGFGGAMIYMPLIAAVYEPRIAAVTLLLVDFMSSTPFVPFEFRRCTWREVLPISVAMAMTVPLGTYLLVVLDPIVLRWTIAT
ncbi:MAG: sulfite exporter TauE/SafE family protein, partial [Hyphomicrobiales bacterium]